MLFLVFCVGSRAQAKLVYSEAANLFHLADQVSLWHPSSPTTFRDYWQKRFGFTQTDKRWFDGFANLRRKYSPEPITWKKESEDEALFSAPDLKNDPLLEAFFTSAQLPQALDKLKDKLDQSERQYLIDFFRQYEARFQEILKESEQFKARLPALNQELTKFRFDFYLKRVERFFGLEQQVSPPSERYRSYLVWWPPEARIEVAQTGPYLLVRAHPPSHFQKMSAEVGLEGAVRSILRSLSPEARALIETQFRAQCTWPKTLEAPLVLELPLTLALSRLAFHEGRDERQFVLAQEWSPHPWVSTMAKLLYDELKRGLRTEESFVQNSLSRAGLVCRELSALQTP